MPRRARKAMGGLVYHVINRGCGRMRLFGKDGDYRAFEQLLCDAHEHAPMRLLSYCLMPNHWHLVLWPDKDGALSKFMFWLTMTHVQRWRHARRLVGLGPLYQGRFKAFAVETDEHYLKVTRYVERNALRAKLVGRAQDWRWSSLAARLGEESPCKGLLKPGPVDLPENYIEWVNAPQTTGEVEAMRRHILTGRPFGSVPWERQISGRLGIDPNPLPRGRPRQRNSGEK